ncbi:MAG: Hpt domain-containing protein, partial [Cyanobacteria bacterium P01_A01_bin.83]
MSSQLDPAILAAITAEARQCFLDEDAPEYLQLLESGLTDREHPDYNALLRAAHSLKGGAGLASLPSLQQLAHKLEDVLVGLQQSQIPEVELAWALVEKSIDEVGYVISQAHTDEDAIANPELIVALEALVASESEPEASSQQEFSSDHNQLIRQTLTEELDNSFVVIEELSIDAPVAVVEPLLTSLVDECSFLADTLELPWLQEAVAPIPESLKSDPTEALLLTQQIISQLRIEIDQYLYSLESAPQAAAPSINANHDLVAQTLNQDLEELCQAIADLAMDTPESVIIEALESFTDECTFLSETFDLPWLAQAVAPVVEILVNCEPLEALLTVQELVGEIRQQRDLYLAQTEPETASEPDAIAISEFVAGDESEFFTDSEAGAFDFAQLEGDTELSTVMFAPPATSPEKILAKVVESSKPAPSSQVKISLERLEDMTNNVEELILSQSRIGRQQKVLNQANRRLRSLTRQFEPIREQIQSMYDQLAVSSIGSSSEENDFDALEMDR